VPGKLFLQQRDGSFVESAQGQPWVTDMDHDDWARCSSMPTGTAGRTCTWRAADISSRPCRPGCRTVSMSTGEADGSYGTRRRCPRC
jgi:hypothetical protein